MNIKLNTFYFFSNYTICNVHHLYNIFVLVQVYNHAQHVICVVHLWRNVIAKYKSSRLANLMSADARAFTVTEFNKKFIEIQKISPNFAAYLVDIGNDYI